MDFNHLATAYVAPGVRAIALFGSHARGDAGPWSDIDLVRFVDGDTSPPGAGTQLYGERLLNVSNIALPQTEAWFTEPNTACNTIAGLRAARLLYDPDGVFALLQNRGRAFVWDDDMQRRADAWSSTAMVGWIEEAHKGLEGLRRNHVGRLLNARHGLSWGLMGVVQVQRGVLIDGDNSVLDQVCAVLDAESAGLLHAAFGVEPVPLAEQVHAGLRLYVRVARQLHHVWSAVDAPLIETTAVRIGRELGLGLF